MTLAVTSEWGEIRNRFYRKLELYSLSWKNVDFSDNIIACAPLGGPVAVIRDEKKLLRLGIAQTRPSIRVFTCSGELISSFPFERPGGVLAGLSWTDEESLVCLVEDGSVYQYNIQGDPSAKEISLGKECWESGVKGCVFWGSGLVALASNLQLFAIPNMSISEVIKLPVGTLTEPPQCMAVIEPKFTSSGQLEVILAIGTTIIIVGPTSKQEKKLSMGPFTFIAVSPNGSRLALFTTQGILIVVTSDFSRKLFEFQTESEILPSQVVWCGSDSVLLSYPSQGEVVMIGVDSDSTITYYYPLEKDPSKSSIRKPIFANAETSGKALTLALNPVSNPDYSQLPGLLLFPEVDGVKVFSDWSVDFISKVPAASVDIFKLGSSTPGAHLMESYRLFIEKKAKVEESPHALGQELTEAVDSCLEAASQEFSPQLQKDLLRAAAYGKAFCRSFGKEKLKIVCMDLRVLNAIRMEGFPLSYYQFKSLTPPVVVARLVKCHKHLLALKICQYLELTQVQEYVLMHWAEAKIKSTPKTESDEKDLVDVLVPRLRESGNVSFSSVSHLALELKRPLVSSLILSHEPMASREVPMRAHLAASPFQAAEALSRASLSGDTDLVHLVLFHLVKKMQEKEFFQILQEIPEAKNLFLAYAKKYDPDMEKKYYLASGDTFGLSEVVLREAWRTSPQSTWGGGGPGARGSALGSVRGVLLDEALELCIRGKGGGQGDNGGKGGFRASAIKEHSSLLRVQQELEFLTGTTSFLDSSISKTISTCIALGKNPAANKVKAEFKVTEKRFYWLKVKSLAVAKDWVELESFSKEKKPPVGYRPFVEVCIEEGANSEAVKYIPKLTEPQERAEAYARIGLVEEAAQAAAQAKDGELFGRVRATLSSQSVAAVSLFDSLKEKFSL